MMRSWNLESQNFKTSSTLEVDAGLSNTWCVWLVIPFYTIRMKVCFTHSSLTVFFAGSEEASSIVVEERACTETKGNMEKQSGTC